MINLEVNEVYNLDFNNKGDLIKVRIRGLSYANDLVTFKIIDKDNYDSKEFYCSISLFKKQLHFGKVIVIDFVNRKRVA